MKIFLCRIFIICALFVTGSAIAQTPYDNQDQRAMAQIPQEEPAPYAAPAPSQPKTDPAVMKKLDQILDALKDLKNELALVRDKLQVLQSRVTR